MTPFKSSLTGETVDLDDPMIVGPHILDHELLLRCMDELGYALMYMQYQHPESDWAEQLKRVQTLCEEFGVSASCRRTDYQYWRGFLYRIQDEIENLV